jgi:magnesium chelatase family protein
MAQIQKYHQKISGPILDRIDLHVEMPAIEYQELVGQTIQETSEDIKKRVLKARAIQAARFPQDSGKTNALMSVREIKKYCTVVDAGKKLLERAIKELEFSARGYHKILKIGRTIADLADSEPIQEEHIAEAIQYRTLDRNWFG